MLADDALNLSDVYAPSPDPDQSADRGDADGLELCRPSEAVLELLPVSKLADFTKEDGEAVSTPACIVAEPLQ